MATRDVYEHDFDETNGNTIDATACPECNGDVVTDGGETHCSRCGLVLDEYRIDHGPEWRSIDGQESSARTGAPVTQARHDRGLSSEIGGWRDAKGNTLSGSKRVQLARLRREHGRARWRSKRERNLGHGCSEIARLSSDLSLSKAVREEACLLFRRAQVNGLLVGRSIEEMAAACVYATCRCRGIGRRPSEIAAGARCGEAVLRSRYGVLNTELGLEAPIVRPHDVLPRIASDLEVSIEVRIRSADLISIAETEGLANGRRPSGVAAACLYAAARERGLELTQRHIAAVAEVSVETLRSRWKEIEEAIELVSRGD